MESQSDLFSTISTNLSTIQEFATSAGGVLIAIVLAGVAVAFGTKILHRAKG